MTESDRSEKVAPPPPTRPPQGPADMDARTAEQEAAVRRRAVPVGVAGAVLGLLGAILPLMREVTANVPPSLLGVNLAFCAMLMGAGILFYARGTPGTRGAAVASVLAILLGMAGTFVYTYQAVQSRQAREVVEIKNVEAVARAAAAYAGKHEGAYPADLLVMLEDGALEARALQSPYGRRDAMFDDLARARGNVAREELGKAVETASDYLYLGADLRNVPKEVAGEILVAVSTNTVMRVNLAVAFADGKGRFITLEEVPGVVAACNAGRKKMGLKELKGAGILEGAGER